MVVLGFSAGLSNFGGAVGLGMLPLRRRHQLEITGTFLAMEILMPLFGLILGAHIAGGIGKNASLFAGLVLVAIGGFTLVETRREARDLEIPVKRSRMVLLATALSIDNLAVGFGLGLLHAPVVLAVSFMGLSSLLLTIVGLWLGGFLGKRAGERAELFSGLVLVAAGVFVILQH